MFKKRDKAGNALKRTNDDRYLDESNCANEEQGDAKRQKVGERQSTKDHSHYRQEYIRQEVQEMASFQPCKETAARENAATKHLEIDTPTDQDAIAKAKKNIEISKAIKEGKLDPNIYRGLNGYQNYIEQTEEDLKHKQFSGTLGPVRAPTFIRNTTRVDYNPERCKDYYETGRCNFGDSCIFIHDRGDYKSGWQLDQEYEAELKRKQLKLMGHQVDDDEENYEIHSQQDENVDSDGLPIVCRICEQIFTDPVVTTCYHYFCERCALQHYAQDGKCFVCSKPTNGIFNECPKMKSKHQKIKEKQKFHEEEVNEESQNEENDQNQTTVTGAQQKIQESSSSDDDGGVLSKKDREVIEQYKSQKQHVEQKKYQAQSGWFIP